MCQLETQTQVKPISIQFYENFGYTRSEALHQLQKNFYLPLDYQDCLEQYQLLFWSADYFLSQVEQGTIVRNGTTYQIIWDDSRGSIIAMPDITAQVKLSFRKGAAGYGLGSYVLVRRAN